MFSVCAHFTHIVCRNVNVSFSECGPMSARMAEPVLLYPLPGPPLAATSGYRREGRGFVGSQAIQPKGHVPRDVLTTYGFVTKLVKNV